MDGKRKFATIAMVSCVVALTLAMRLYHIDQESAWHDEVFSMVPLQEDSFSAYWDTFESIDPNATMAPAYFLTQYVWAQVFGSSLIAMRYYSVLLAMLTLIPLFLIGRRLFNTEAAIIACFCFAVSLPNITFGQEVRMHAFATLFTILSMWTFLVALDTGQKRWWCANFIASTIMFFASQMTGFIFAIQGCIFLLFHLKPYRRFTGWITAQFSILFMMWVWATINRKNFDNPFWSDAPTWKEFANHLVVFLGGRVGNDDPTPYLLYPLSLEPLMILGFLSALVFLFHVARQNREENENILATYRIPLILLLWLSIPISLCYILSVLWKPFFMYRYLLYSTFAIFLIVGGSLSKVQSNKRKAMIFCCMFIVIIYQHTIRLNHTFRPNYQLAMSHIMTDQDKDIPVVVLKDKLNRSSLEFLEDWESREAYFVPGQSHLNESTLDLTQKHKGLWVLMWRWDNSPAYETFLSENDIAMTKYPVGGIPVMVLYRLQTD